MKLVKAVFFFLILFFSANAVHGQLTCITLTSGIEKQEVCVNTPIVNIVYTLGSGVIATVTDLPPGVSATQVGTTFTISGSPVSTGTFNYLVTTTGICSGSRTANGVIVSNDPAAPTAPSLQTFCMINAPTVANLSASGTNIQWYTSATGGTPLLSTTPLASGTYYASQTVGNCESTTRTQVSVIVNNPAPPTTVTPQTFCSIDNPTLANLYISGNNIKWYSVATGGTALPSSTALQSGTYYASQTVGGCESTARAAVVVVVNDPSAPTGSVTQNFCLADNPTVASLTATGQSIKWYLFSSGGTALLPTQALTTRTYYASQTINGCESALRFAVAVTVANPETPTAPSPQAFCLINNPTVADLVVSGTGITWYLSATGGVPLLPTAPLTSGTYYASQTLGSCVSATRRAVTVTVSNPAAPTGTSPQAFCAITNPTVANLTATGTGIKWYTTATGGTALVSTAALATGTYYASQTVNGCESMARLPVSVTVNNPPAPTGSATQAFCSGTNSTVANLVATGTGIQWYQTATGGAPLAPTTLLTTGTYYASQTINGCESTARLAVAVTVHQAPVANAGNGGTQCGLTFLLNAVPTVGTGVWSLVTGPGTASFSPSASQPGASVTVSVNGTYTFRWTETNGPCTSSSVVTVVFLQLPVANAGASGDACGLTFPLAAVPSVGVGTWTMTSGTGTATFLPNANSPTATVTVSEYGSKVFTWTEVNETCTSSATVTINFLQQPVVNAGTGGNNCGYQFNLSAVPSVGTGTWSRVSGPGNASFSPNTHAPNATVTVTSYGTYVFRWTETNGSCSGNETVSVTFIQQPSANAGRGGNECDLDFVLNAVQGTGVGTWTKVSGPGNATFRPNANTPNATVTVTQFGAYDFAWTEVNNQCSSSDIIRVTFNDLPAINAGADALICKGGNVRLNATGTGSFSWEPAGSLNNPFVPNPLATPGETTTYTVTLTDQWGCKNSDQVTVEVRTQPVADAGPDQVLEFKFNTRMAAAPLEKNQRGEWSVIDGKASFSNKNDPATRVSDLGIENNTFVWTVTNEACPPSTDTVNIFVHNLIIPTLITPNLDGNNDYFVIKGIETLGKTSLVIFNRWGARVYEKDDYDNSWDGTDDNSNQLAEDTYFYILKSEEGMTFKGYVIIRR